MQPGGCPDHRRAGDRDQDHEPAEDRDLRPGSAPGTRAGAASPGIEDAKDAIDPFRSRLEQVEHERQADHGGTDQPHEAAEPSCQPAPQQAQVVPQEVLPVRGLIRRAGRLGLIPLLGSRGFGTAGRLPGRFRPRAPGVPFRGWIAPSEVSTRSPPTATVVSARSCPGGGGTDRTA